MEDRRHRRIFWDVQYNISAADMNQLYPGIPQLLKKLISAYESLGFLATGQIFSPKTLGGVGRKNSINVLAVQSLNQETVFPNLLRSERSGTESPRVPRFQVTN